MIKIPKRFIFMKVGNHAGEDWESILDRKRREIQQAGASFWGYGGRTCHPINQVQPFARLSLKEENGIFLIMQPIVSNADPDIVPAKEFSEDGINWNPIPQGVLVTGSRYALVLGEITPAEFEIDLRSFEVGVGPSRGRNAEEYLQGRTDKACLIRSDVSRPEFFSTTSSVRKIGYIAKMKDPFAVILRV
jgi:hypothetical protein